MQIAAKDLRVGNYLQDRKGQYCLVERIEADIEDCKIPAIDVSTTYLPVDGIPLSPDILVKCGFVKSAAVDGYTKEFFPYLIQDDMWWALFNFSNDNTYYRITSCDIQYLHQLQNLFYSLVGHELEINL